MAPCFDWSAASASSEITLASVSDATNSSAELSSEVASVLAISFAGSVESSSASVDSVELFSFSSTTFVASVVTPATSVSVFSGTLVALAASVSVFSGTVDSAGLTTSASVFSVVEDVSVVFSTSTGVVLFAESEITVLFASVSEVFVSPTLTSESVAVAAVDSVATCSVLARVSVAEEFSTVSSACTAVVPIAATKTPDNKRVPIAP